MKREAIVEKVIACIEKMGGEKLSQRDETLNLVNDLGFDSLDAVEFVMELEQAFNIRISNSEAYQISSKISTVSGVVDFISTKLEA